MILKTITLLLLLCAAFGEEYLIPIDHQSTSACSRVCNFRACIKVSSRDVPRQEGPTIILPPPGTPLNLFPCKQAKASSTRYRQMLNITIGQVRVANIFNGRSTRYRPISAFGRGRCIPAGRYPAQIFDTITRNPAIGATQISLRSLSKQQYRCLSNTCIRLPITQHQVMFQPGRITRVFKSRGLGACVAFKALAPKLYIRLTWSGGDDLDLFWWEPGGFTLSRVNQESPDTGGAFAVDNGFRNPCRASRLSEVVTYLPVDTPVTGLYTARVNVFSRCGGTVRWTLDVIQEARLITRRTGVIDALRPSPTPIPIMLTFP